MFQLFSFYCKRLSGLRESVVDRAESLKAHTTSVLLLRSPRKPSGQN